MIDEYIKEQRTERASTTKLYSTQIDAIIDALNVQIQEVVESKNIKDEEDLDTAKIGQRVKHKSMSDEK